MIFKFTDEAELKIVTELVRLVNNIYDHSAVETISSLLHSLERCNGMIYLDEDERNNNDYNELVCLFNIVKMFSNLGEEDVSAADTVYKVLKDYAVPSDVPRFVAMLADFSINPRYCASLFEAWASEEAFGPIAIECMEIQAEHNVNMTGPYTWMQNNDPNPEVKWEEDAAKYRKEVFG